VPLLTQGTPSLLGVSQENVATARRAEGTEQVTYKGKPLYLYWHEKFIVSPPSPTPQESGTAGNGDGLAGPGGGMFSVVLP
jgi:hypothetical protein